MIASITIFKNNTSITYIVVVMHINCTSINLSNTSVSIIAASNVRSDNDAVSQSEDDLAVVKVEAAHEYHESKEDPLNKMMDDNGILWEDDTLPDVSDSEFDRVRTFIYI